MSGWIEARITYALIMAENIIIEPASESLDPDALRKRLDRSGSGCIVSFIGFTRGHDQGEEVIRLEFDAWKGRLEEVLRDLAKQAIDKFNLLGVAMSHRVGNVLPEEPIVAIHVASAHRNGGFTACSWLIDELKNQAPLWKKEVKPSGETWKTGLG